MHILVLTQSLWALSLLGLLVGAAQTSDNTVLGTGAWGTGKADIP